MSVLFLRQLAKQVEHLISVAADEHAGIIILIRRSISISQGLSTVVIILIKAAFGRPRIQSRLSCPVNNIKRIPMNISIIFQIIGHKCKLSPHTFRLEVKKFFFLLQYSFFCLFLFTIRPISAADNEHGTNHTHSTDDDYDDLR
ncbi:hypothetical protein T03_17977 [Trichinella britovi]|uniref:Uncharacterized protein n=1 Tax=Trichinella britovi TaxID=45882 RepID=A0A0V1CGY6_TRIBR|nr:hypothetical protein T03_17977 [Trichinella britovi]